ncbi:MAG TPA: hypothetical protein PK076_10335 [Saprospiraceae bacterium]|nr:hypothetical protein [Saprospiraceae bacterium]HQW56517.1 hypothetical protein [Saprospiraceae bacterium]
MILISCHNTGKNLSNEDLRFSRALANVYMANAAANLIQQGNKDSSRRVLVTKALALEDMDTLYFNSQLEKYSKNPSLLETVYDSSTKFIERQQR